MLLHLWRSSVSALHVDVMIARNLPLVHNTIGVFPRNHLSRRALRGFKVHRNGSIAPRIFQLVTAVRNVDDFNGVFSGSFFKAACLVAQLIREQKQSPWFGPRLFG